MSGVFHVGDGAYDSFMGRYSVRLAPLFADFADVQAGERALDVGAGTGALTEDLRRRGATVTAVEPSAEFAATLRARYDDVHEGPAEQLPFADDAFDVALAQLVVAFMADAPAGVGEMARVARRVAVCMWGVAEMELFAAIDRTAQVVGGGSSQPGARRYRTLEELVELLEPVGDVETAIFDITAPYDDFDDFWSALMGQVGPAGAWVKNLSADQQAAAREEMSRQLGGPNGTFTLTGRCYAAKVTRA